MPTFSAILFLVGVGMIKVKKIRCCLRARQNKVLFWLTYLTVMFIGLKAGIGIAILLSVLNFLLHANRLEITDTHPADYQGASYQPNAHLPRRIGQQRTEPFRYCKRRRLQWLLRHPPSQAGIPVANDHNCNSERKTACRNDPGNSHARYKIPHQLAATIKNHQGRLASSILRLIISRVAWLTNWTDGDIDFFIPKNQQISTIYKTTRPHRNGRFVLFIAPIETLGSSGPQNGTKMVSQDHTQYQTSPKSLWYRSVFARWFSELTL